MADKKPSRLQQKYPGVDISYREIDTDSLSGDTAKAHAECVAAAGVLATAQNKREVAYSAALVSKGLIPKGQTAEFVYGYGKFSIAGRAGTDGNWEPLASSPTAAKTGKFSL